MTERRGEPAPQRFRPHRLDLAGTRDFARPGAGAARRQAISEHTRAWLRDVWDEARAGRRLDGVALAAVGSLARGESGPLSDLDLVLLHHPRGLAGPEVAAFADRLWYPLWDSGVRLDHSVRTVAECRAVAAVDLTAATGLLDLAHIAGDADVVAAARSTVAHDWRANARTRLPEIEEALAARYARHGDLAHLVEPDLKEARGGLRDMAVLRALSAAWLADRPHGDTDAAYGRLLDVRDALHVVTGRHRDLLGREDQDACAALLGEPDADALVATVAGSARVIAYAAHTTLRRALQSQRARVLRVRARRPQLAPLGYGLYRHEGEVVLGSPGAAADPLLPLRAAVVAAGNGLPLSPATLHNLAELAPPLPQPWPELARDLFTDLLAAGPGLVAVWEGLDLAGLIDRLLPEWAGVRCRPQRSAVHRHTVDRHLIETVVVASGMVRDLGRPDLLLLAALLHDLGKVRGAHDHSSTGAGLADSVLRRMGVPDADRAVVVRLVREHLTLVELATRRDPTDPRTSAALSEAVAGSASTLQLLRALTEADARAAGPLAWTDWRAGLVERLYLMGRQALGYGPDSAPRVARPEPVAARWLDQLTSAHLDELAHERPAVAVEAHGGAHRVVVVDRDRVGLFADTAGLLAAHGLVIRSATVRTHDGLAVNEWWVDSPGGEVPIAERIARDLLRVAGGDRGPLAVLDRRRAAPSLRSRVSGSAGQSRALVLTGVSDTATVIEVRAADRPGLLRDIGLALAGASSTIRSAHVATHAGQALDTFYVTESGGGRLAPARAAHAVSVILEACDGP